MSTTLFGIKNCDTVKKARKFLEQNTIDFSFHDFRADGLSDQQVVTFIQKIGLDTLINKRSTTWKQLTQEQRDNLNETNAISLCTEHPTLIKRPVLVYNGDYYCGFKDSDYQAIFNKTH